MLKAGTTNIGRTLYTLDHLDEYTDANKVNKHVSIGSRYRKMYEDEASFEADFKSYTKFMFVREPIERLLSAYKSRNPGSMFKHRNYTFQSFQSFLEKIAATPHGKTNRHHYSYFRMCSRINFDFIGSVDSVNEDMNTILQPVGADKYITLPKRNQTGYSPQKTSETLQKYLKDIPKSLIKKLYEKYYWDYFLFGFAKPDF